MRVQLQLSYVFKIAKSKRIVFLWRDKKLFLKSYKEHRKQCRILILFRDKQIDNITSFSSQFFRNTKYRNMIL